MPVYPLNNVATQDTYSDAVMTVFPFPNNSMTVQAYNAGVYYKLLYVPKDSLQTSSFQADPYEHFLGPSFAAFDESDLPAGQAFAGIMFRSAVIGVPANVTVL